MSLKRWYVLMLFAPLLLPAILFLRAELIGYDALMNEFSDVLRLIFLCALIAGVPYFVFAVILTCKCRKKSADEIKKISWWLPWMFTPLCGLFFWAAFSLFYPEGDALQGTFIMMALCVPACFFYIFMVHLITRLAINTKCIKEEHAKP